ncbi:hypothetical protein [Ruminococcus flavefaciens]|uniref:hypothetical protein n=1 Tax=Ruminococcus flavefaciens TaxID=1265 RepID=UPI00049098F6|nr:hypothetical protein [Ruminococcus flavefaciens]
MDFEEEYKQNRTQMKKIKKDDTKMFVIFMCNIAVAILCLIAFVLSGNMGALLVSSLAAAASVTGLISVYNKNIALSVVSGVLLIAEIISMFSVGSFTILGFVEFAAFVWVAVRSFKNIKQYQWLAQQDGFPQFEPKLKEYDMNRTKWETKNPYAQKMAERQKNSSGSMEEL